MIHLIAAHRLSHTTQHVLSFSFINVVIVLLQSIMNHCEIRRNDYYYNDTPKDANNIIIPSSPLVNKKDRNRIYCPKNLGF